MDGSVNTSGVDEGSSVGTGKGVDVRNNTVGGGSRLGIAVGIALWVSTKAVLTVDIAVCMISA
jgi:hypothetical protein